MNQVRHNRLLTGSLYTLVLLIALGLKYHYSRAGSDDLLWMLSPTAGLVEALSNVRFEKEENTGYVNQVHRVIIAPSCAGINFMIIAFCMAAFSGLNNLDRSALKNLWPGISLVTAYMLTLCVNTIRIISSIHFYEAELFQSWGTQEMIHRIEGILIYFTCLAFFYLMLEKILGWIQYKTAQKKAHFEPITGFLKTVYTCFIPVIWYCGLTIGIPFLNSAYRKEGQRFVEHSAVVIMICLFSVMVFFLIRLSCKGLATKIKWPRNG